MYDIAAAPDTVSPITDVVFGHSHLVPPVTAAPVRVRAEIAAGAGLARAGTVRAMNPDRPASSPARLDALAGAVATSCDSAPDDTRLVAGIDADDDILTLLAGDADQPSPAELDELFAAAGAFAALATRVRWSPTPDGPSSDAWLLVAVMTGLPALFATRRLAEDARWTRLPAEHAPWMALSTAAGLRRALDTGAPLTLKTVADAGLLRTPSESPAPAAGPDGQL